MSNREHRGSAHDPRVTSREQLGRKARSKPGGDMTLSRALLPYDFYGIKLLRLNGIAMSREILKSPL